MRAPTPALFLAGSLLARIASADVAAEPSLRREEPPEPPVPPATSVDPARPAAPFAGRLAIKVVTTESALPTFAERVGSWLSDGTRVELTLVAESSPAELLAVAPAEVRVWVVPLSDERALVTFSLVAEDGSARHLVREVRLRNGLDDLGLERLASVIHSAFVALREGVEGSERAQVERELSEAGLIVHTPPRPAAAAPVGAAGVRAPQRDATPSARDVAPSDRTGAGAPSLLAALGYGARFRGAERVGQGPNAALGLRLPAAPAALVVLLSGQYLFRSSFDARSLNASVQTSALRARFGIEPEISSGLGAQALVGAGADVARIRPESAADGNVEPRASGTQLRFAGELTLGAWWRLGLLELGVLGELTFLPGDVHYSMTAGTEDRRLVTPWPIQPSFGVQARFRSAL